MYRRLATTRGGSASPPPLGAATDIIPQGRGMVARQSYNRSARGYSNSNSASTSSTSGSGSSSSSSTMAISRSRYPGHQFIPMPASTPNSPLIHRASPLPGRRTPSRHGSQTYSTYPDEDDHRRRRLRIITWLQHPKRRLHLLYSAIAALILFFTFSRGFSHVPNGASSSPHQSAMGRAATPMAGAAWRNEVGSSKRLVVDSGYTTPLVPLPSFTRAHSIKNGRLQVDPSSTVHPIHQLISDAREAWDAKVANQSRTLPEAVAEYKRRYKRPPPRGFDKWWQYVVDNKVQLPDEYDQIERDLHLFWALHPRDLRRRIENAGTREDTFSIKVKRGQLRISGKFGQDVVNHRDRRDGQFALIKDVAEHIPDMEAVYTSHDTPWNILSWGHRQTLLEYLENDEYIDMTEEEADLTYAGWRAACPPSSPLHTYDPSAPLPPPTDDISNRSFIVDVKANMDPCQNPEFTRLHGSLTGKTPTDEPLSALFSISKTALHGDILGVPPEKVVVLNDTTPWSEKTDNRLFWRGTNTGMYYSTDLDWRESHRVRLTRLSDESRGTRTILPPPGIMGGKSLKETATRVHKGTANPHYFDMGFVDQPIQCNVEDGTCDDIKREYPFRDYVYAEDVGKYKYFIDVDGNGWSARFQRSLATGALVFKSTIMPEWWNDRIQPWVHYVPVKLDYSDVHDSIAFFAGDIDGLGGADDLARNIAEEGQAWSKNFYRTEDMTAYVFRLYLEWARLQAPNRNSMFYQEEA